MKNMHRLDAINEALHEELERDEKVFIIAEDVGEYGGVWNASRGLYEKYGFLYYKNMLDITGNNSRIYIKKL